MSHIKSQDEEAMLVYALYSSWLGDFCPICIFLFLPRMKINKIKISE